MTRAFQQTQTDYSLLQTSIEKLRLEVTQLSLASSDKLTQIEEE
jgi:hypothetical protein